LENLFYFVGCWTFTTCASKESKNYTKSYIQTKDLAKYVGKGLLTVEGEHWQKKQRKLIQPAFQRPT
jgi:cytochrome P450